MTLDCDNYRINVPVIAELTHDKTEAQRIEMLGKLAVITGVPIIVVTCYVGELYGFTPKLQASLDRFKSFYTVEHVLNVKEPITV